MQEVIKYLDTNRQTHRSELFDFLRIPSVSAQSDHKKDVRRCAEWLREAMSGVGLKSRIMETAGHPVVLGEWRDAGPNAKTVLVYGHYDVQPAEPLELWDSPPFEPAVRAGRIYARGSVDDKGQLFLHLKAIEAHMRVNGRLPVNVVVMAEGEEEIGSDHLAPFVEQHAELLKCDAVVISDSAMFAPGIPSILSSLRGLAYFQIDVEGPTTDLHSGTYGGAVVNPATALARMIASLHDETGHVAIHGFYDSVRDALPEMRENVRDLPFQEEHFRLETGAEELGGELGFSTLERIWTRPTCEVNGLLSGYTGEGAKTVLPSKAMAKVSCRLVPDQDPAEIEKLVRDHITSVAPSGVRVNLRFLHGGKPWRANLTGPIYDAAKSALKSAFDREPVITGEGGSIPVVGDFARVLGAPVLLLGFGLPGENAHAPNEWISVANFEKGAVAIAHLWDEYGSR
jgi:acetylornithine deacetylase/succinyl-diaminopimelate desuccinylase-like protein